MNARLLSRATLATLATLVLTTTSACLDAGDLGARCADDGSCADGLLCIPVTDAERGVCLSTAPVTGPCSEVVELERDVVLTTTSDITDLLPVDDDRCLTIDGSVVVEQTSLRDLDGLERLVGVQGDLIVRTNPDLKDLGGLDGLLTVAGRVEVLENRELLAVGLDGLTRAGELWLTGTDNLTSPAGLRALARVDGRVWLANHSALRDVSSLAGLQIAGALEVTDNDLLVDLAGLSALTEVSGALTVARNGQLPTIDGLSSLNDVGGALIVEDNPALPSCEVEALAARVAPSSTTIAGNDDLGACE